MTTSQRNVYLKKKTLAEAKEILFTHFRGVGPTETEEIPVEAAVGRVLAAPVYANISSPNYHAAAMDGIAVDAKNTFGASETHPIALIPGENAFLVNTGQMLPPHTNAVIMIEEVDEQPDGSLEIIRPAYPWQYVRKMGEDIVATELLFPGNHEITPYCIGAILSAGVRHVPVRKKPKLLIIPTGSELLDWRGQSEICPEPGQVVETNSIVLGKLAESFGAEFIRHDPVPDDEQQIRNAICAGLDADYDVVMTVGGSSAGSEDYTRQIVAELGEVLVHGITIMPGKPTIIGKIHGKPVFGIPGYPVSAIIAFEQLVQPLIRDFLGQTVKSRETINVTPIRNIPSKLGVEEFLRVKIGVVGQRVIATQLPRGAGSITSITEAHGIIRIPNHVEGLKAGEPVAAELIRSKEEIGNTLVVVGSHDNTLDLLEDLLKTSTTHRVHLSSSHVGSMGGLMAVKNGACHLAGSHLLDTETGIYNETYIQRYLPETPVRLVRLVSRAQGLIIAKGNPKGIQGITDLTRNDIRYLNRQKGAGTRILFDDQLAKLHIDPGSINGYENEEFTHMSVAVGVLSGVADAGMGIYAAAKALGLDFIPVVKEQYDLIIPEVHFHSPAVQTLLHIIGGEEFKSKVQALGGYGTEQTGTLIMTHP